MLDKKKKDIVFSCFLFILILKRRTIPEMNDLIFII